MASSPLTTQWIGCNPSNFNGGRGGYNVNGIVIHHAVCLNIGAMDAVFQRYGYGGSAHYGVWGNTVHQYVDENDTAWHCSNYWGNQNTIGIECVNSALGGDYPVADDTLEMLIRLVADIAKRYNLGRLYVNPSEDCPKISGHRDWYGAATACPGDYLYARLQYIADRANDINYPPEPPKREIKWHDVPTTTMMVDGVTHLYNLETDEQICEVSGEVTFIQMTEDNGWVRTQYSKEKNLNNGIAYHRLVPIPEPTPEPTPEPEPPHIEWVDVPETTLRIKDGGTNLVNIVTGEVIKHLEGDFTFVQKTSDGAYVRALYSKEKGIDNGVLYADLVQPEPQPDPQPEPTPEPEPEPTPEPTPDPGDDTPNWFIRFIHALGEFFTHLFTRKEK